MKKLILVLSFLTGLNIMAHAQLAQRSPEKRAAHQTKALQKRLHLSADQAAKVNTVLLAQANSIDSLKSAPATDIKAGKLAIKNIRLNTRKQVLSILDDPQKQKFADWEKMRKERRKAKKADSESQQG